MSFSEKLTAFGPDKGLSGMLALPTARGAQPPGVILYNAGIVHRIGPHRLNVKIARALAARGVPSLRFDLSGLGDSAPAPSGSSWAQSQADLSAAMTQLSNAGAATRFVLVGLCSGADNAYRAAIADNRIAGVVLIDPYSYENRRAKLERAAARALDLERWKSALARAGAPARRSQPNEEDSSRPYPPLAEFGADLAKLTNKGVEILIVYTRFVEQHLTRPEHFFDTFADFDFCGRLAVEVNGAVDHTHTELTAQSGLIDRIGRFVDTLKS